MSFLFTFFLLMMLAGLFFGHRGMDSEKEEQPLLALAHAWSLRSPPQACDSKAVTGCSPEAGLWSLLPFRRDLAQAFQLLVLDLEVENILLPTPRRALLFCRPSARALRKGVGRWKGCSRRARVEAKDFFLFLISSPGRRPSALKATAMRRKSKSLGQAPL